MEPLKLAKQMMELNKATFDNTFNAMVTMQEQTERMVNSFLDQANWLPGESKNLMQDWVAAYKKEREEYKKMVDDSFNKAEACFTDATKSN